MTQVELAIFLFPVPERKISVGSRQSNLKSGENVNKGRHVVIKTDYQNTNLRNTNQINMELITNKTPLLQEYRHVGSQTKQRPTSLNLIKSEKFLRSAAMRNRSKSIDNTQKEEKREDKREKKSFESLHRLKEKLLHSNPELNETSDNESTPLVSEVSTPSKSGHESSEMKTSSSKSFPLSPLSQKSLSPERASKCTRSEQNLTDTMEINQSAEVFLGNSGAKSCCVTQGRRRTFSDDNSTSLSIYLGSLEPSNSNISLYSCSLSPGHLSRQDALDADDNFTDVYCDPGSRKD